MIAPDHNDPRTPAIMAWTDYNREFLIWRKSQAGIDAGLADPGYGVDCDGYTLAGWQWRGAGGGLVRKVDLETPKWTPIKFRALPPRLRMLILSGVRVWSLAAAHTGRMCYTGPSGFTYRGVTSPYHQTFLHIRDTVRGFAKHIKSALAVYTDGTWRDEANAKEDLLDYGSRLVGTEMRGKFVYAVNRAFSDNGFDEPLVMADCGHIARDGDVTTAHNRATYCSSCADEDLREIDGEYYHKNDCYYWDSDGEYHTDPEPDEDEDEDEPNSDRINSWGSSTRHLGHEHIKQTPHSDFTMGVELEVECEDSSDFSEAIDECHYHFNDKYTYAMFKRDGSLSERGFEIVTAARRLPDHLEKFKNWTPHDTLRAWKPGNCGVHVHIDSRAFSALTLGKFLMFINADDNTSFITAIAGRHPRNDSGARSYCSQIHQDSLDSPATAVKSSNHSRYRMVNLCNLSYDEQRRLKAAEVSRDCKGDYSTVELRIFRASLKKERLLAQIEFSHAAVMFCRTASWHQLRGEDFKRWLAGTAGHYKHLARWFGVTVPKTDNRKAPVVAREEAVCA